MKHPVFLSVFTLALMFLTGCDEDPIIFPDDDDVRYDDGIMPAAVTDIDGNTYDAVRLGEQVWMAENLRVTRLPNGTPIGPDTTSAVCGNRFCPDGDSANIETFGYLYDWSAAIGGHPNYGNPMARLQGICPDGWHLPSDAEWTQLTDYLSTCRNYVSGYNTENIAKALASTEQWSVSNEDYAVGNNPAQNNATGFGALPAGDYAFGTYANTHDATAFWSSSQQDSQNSYAYGRNLSFNCPVVNRNVYYRDNGCSVRCVRD